MIDEVFYSAEVAAVRAPGDVESDGAAVTKSPRPTAVRCAPGIGRAS